MDRSEWYVLVFTLFRQQFLVMERFPVHLNGRPIPNGRPQCLGYVGKELIVGMTVDTLPAVLAEVPFVPP